MKVLDSFVPKKKVATPAQKKSLELAQARKKPDAKKKSDNKENEPPSKANKRQTKEGVKELQVSTKQTKTVPRTKP